MRAVNAAIFVPHAGCPHRCSFCDQRAIANTSRIATAQSVTATLSAAVTDLERLRRENPGVRAQVAFFGGSFTAIERGYMTQLLDAARPFVGEGGFDSIRVSTRPDAIDGEIINILRDYRVTTVELGAQSTDEGVLSANLRGHTREDIFNAACALRDGGFELGLQMMTGLYRSSPQKDLNTARELLNCRPDFMRVYPTAVFADTLLERLWREGSYSPPGVEQSVELCADILRMADGIGVPVVRLGLHSDISPDSKPLAGAFHPAFGELVISRIYLQNMLQMLQNLPRNCYTVYVSADMLSAAVGQHRSNITALENKGYTVTVTPREGLRRYEVTMGV